MTSKPTSVLKRRDREGDSHEQGEEHAMIRTHQIRIRKEDAEQESPGERHGDPEDAREKRASPALAYDAEVYFEPGHDEQKNDRDGRIAREHVLGRSRREEPHLCARSHATKDRRPEKDAGREFAEDEWEPEAARDLAQKPSGTQKRRERQEKDEDVVLLHWRQHNSARGPSYEARSRRLQVVPPLFSAALSLRLASVGGLLPRSSDRARARVLPRESSATLSVSLAQTGALW
jgi:hypothetical protein